MADMIRGSKSGAASASVLQGIHMGGTTSLVSGACNKALQLGVSRSDIQGMPLVPSLEVHFKGSWRFKWVVSSGTRTISVWTRQAVNQTPRPALIVRANSDVGLLADITSVAPAGSGWVLIPAASFVATATGVLWVELHNRLDATTDSTFFDHVTAT